MLDELPVDVLGDGLSYPGHVNLCQCFGHYAFFVQIVIFRQGTIAGATAHEKQNTHHCCH